MDKIVYQEGYDAAIEAIKQALQKQASGQNPQPNRQDQKNANKQGMDTSINPQGNGGELSKAAAAQQNQQGNPQSGQGQSGQGQSGSGSGGNSNQQKPADWIKGWNQALADYNSGKLKI